MPADGEHWDGDETWRDLRNAIDELLVDIDGRAVTGATLGPELTEKEVPISGLSIFAPDTADAWRFELATYAESSFAKKTSWDDIVRQIFAD